MRLTIRHYLAVISLVMAMANSAQAVRFLPPLFVDTCQCYRGIYGLPITAQTQGWIDQVIRDNALCYAVGNIVLTIHTLTGPLGDETYSPAPVVGGRAFLDLATGEQVPLPPREEEECIPSLNH